MKKYFSLLLALMLFGSASVANAEQGTTAKRKFNTWQVEAKKAPAKEQSVAQKPAADNSAWKKQLEAKAESMKKSNKTEIAKAEAKPVKVETAKPVVQSVKPQVAKSQSTTTSKNDLKKAAKLKKQKNKQKPVKKEEKTVVTNNNQKLRWQAYAKNGINNVSGEAIVKEASKYKGVRYVFGGTTPKGLDCSGYVQYVFKRLNANLTRTADTQVKEGVFVTQRQLKPGDLVFFSTYESGASHVGIYAGNGKFWNATSSRGIMLCGLQEDYWRTRYYGARRVLVANGEPK